MHCFIKTLIEASKCELLEVDDDMETLKDDNVISIRLLDSQGDPHYEDTSISQEELLKLIPITLLFNQSEGDVMSEFDGFTLD